MRSPSLGVRNVGICLVRLTLSDASTIAFEKSHAWRTLEILNLIGRNVGGFPIPPDCEQIQIRIADLPPGCYFARIGNQFAKFVVPPR
ncbi:MAG: hypothetical protein Q8922_13870 [Bacteroidota bacterium]|nr:hypothetical protein [Bacteroidota bacterium]MDP4232355.1 hypothetical protein [Bacteroidota bacterium]MDP4289010.1 hypothetical protein [Bacteroidota bacterium]